MSAPRGGTRGRQDIDGGRADRSTPFQLREKYQVLPSMPPEQFEALKADIAERGVLTPIDIDENGFILDGHHRYRACSELGVTEFPTIVRPGMTEEERRMFARKSNMLRRHLTREQVRQLIAEQLRDTPNWANNRIGQCLGTDSKTVQAVRKQLEATSEIPKLDRLMGVDGKERSTKQKRPPAIMATNVTDLQRILDRLQGGIDLSQIEGFSDEHGLTFIGVLSQPFDFLEPEQQDEWELFADFLAERLHATKEWAADHVAWITRKDFETPDEWLGDEGRAFRAAIGMHGGDMRKVALAWREFREAAG